MIQIAAHLIFFLSLSNRLCASARSSVASLDSLFCSFFFRKSRWYHEFSRLIIFSFGGKKIVCLYLLNSMSSVFADERSISMFRLLLRFTSLLFYLNNVIVYLIRYIAYIVGETYDVGRIQNNRQKKSAWPVSKKLQTKKKMLHFPIVRKS